MARENALARGNWKGNSSKPANGVQQRVVSRVYAPQQRRQVSTMFARSGIAGNVAATGMGGSKERTGKGAQRREPEELYQATRIVNG